MSLKFGLNENVIKKINSVFEKHTVVEKAIIYGSRAKGNYREGSDIDLTLFGDGITINNLSTILDQLDDLLLPYTIDLSIYHHLKNDKLKEHINRVGKIFYLVDTGFKPVSTNGWEIRDFEDCIESIVYTNKIQKKDFLDDGKFPIISQEQDFINGYWDNPEDLFKLKKPVVIFGDHTQVIKYIDFNFVLGADGVKILQTNNEIFPRYFYYYLKNISIDNLGYARHYRLLKEVKITYPKSLSEQKRIVAILDQAFTGIKKAKENAEKNLANAKELFESYLNGIFNNPGEDWEEKRLGEVGITQTGTTPKTIEKENYGNFIPFIKPADVDYLGDGQLRYDNEGLSEIGLNKGRLIKCNSILMVCIGATIGKVGFTVKDVSCNQQINSLTIQNKNYFPKYFYYLMVSKNFQEKVIKEGKGAQATLPIINKTKWENLLIKYPKSLVIQTSIVSKLDELSAETKRLEGIYRKKIDDLEELKKAILEKAFRGEM